MGLAFQPLLPTVRPQPSQLRCRSRTEAAFPTEGRAIYLLSVGSVLFSKQSCCLPLHKATCGKQRLRARTRRCNAYPPTSTRRGIAWVNRDNLIARQGTERREAWAALHGKYPNQRYARQQGRPSRRAAGAPKGHVLIKTRPNTRKLVAQLTAVRAALKP